MSSQSGQKKPGGSLNPLLQNLPGEVETHHAPKKKERTYVEHPPVELAAAVLLLEVASADSRISIHQKGIIQAGLQMLFGLSGELALENMHQAQNTLRSLRGSSSFATALKEQLDEPMKIFLMNVMDDVIRADGKNSDMETYHKNRFRMLLGLPDISAVAESK